MARSRNLVARSSPAVSRGKVAFSQQVDPAALVKVSVSRSDSLSVSVLSPKGSSGDGSIDEMTHHDVSVLWRASGVLYVRHRSPDRAHSADTRMVQLMASEGVRGDSANPTTHTKSTQAAPADFGGWGRHRNKYANACATRTAPIHLNPARLMRHSA